jgi:hypothetical protein
MSPPPIPRREDRHLIPFSSVVLNAELFTSSFCHVGYLWDVSASGACLCFSEEPATSAMRTTYRFVFSGLRKSNPSPPHAVWPG